MTFQILEMQKDRLYILATFCNHNKTPWPKAIKEGQVCFGLQFQKLGFIMRMAWQDRRSQNLTITGCPNTKSRDSKGKVGWNYKPSKTTFQWRTSSTKAVFPKGSRTSPNITTTWQPIISKMLQNVHNIKFTNFSLSECHIVLQPNSRVFQSCSV